MLNEGTSKAHSTGAIATGGKRGGDGLPMPKAVADLLRLLVQHRQGPSARLTLWLGPDLAQDLLGKNHPKNRVLSGAHLRKLIRDHEAGKFCYTPAPIILDGEGVLGDGQHRCSMVAQTGAPIIVDIVQMFSADDFERARLVVDTGRTRTRGHVLEIAGMVPPGKGALANGILGRIGYFHAGIDTTRSNMEQVAAFRPWATAINKALALRTRWNMAMRAAAAVCLKHRASSAEELFRQFDTNIDLKAGMASHALAMMQPLFTKGRGRAHDEEVMLFILKAAHKHMTGGLMRASAKSAYGYSTRPSPHAMEYFFGDDLREAWREQCARMCKTNSREE